MMISAKSPNGSHRQPPVAAHKPSERPPDHRPERPTLRQFKRILKQKFDLETTIRKRAGDKEFEQNHRARLGSMDQDCHGVGHIYEIDATIADVFVVSSRDRSRIIGKPTLYLIYDRRSRLIVGFYVDIVDDRLEERRLRRQQERKQAGR